MAADALFRLPSVKHTIPTITTTNKHTKLPIITIRRMNTTESAPDNLALRVSTAKKHYCRRHAEEADSHDSPFLFFLYDELGILSVGSCLSGAINKFVSECVRKQALHRKKSSTVADHSGTRRLHGTMGKSYH